MDISTVSAHSLEWYENAGKLSKIAIDENQIPPEDRIPRITAATWCELCHSLSDPYPTDRWVDTRKYESGAVGSLTHLIALQGHDYSCELEVYADGYQLK